MRKIITTFIATAGLAVALGQAVPAAAQEHETRTVEVVTTDLDLGTALGRTALHHRLVAAVRQVCGEAGTSDIQAQADVGKCRAAANADAARQAQRVVAAHQAAAYALASRAPN